MVNTATVAMAGRNSGRMMKKKMLYSDKPIAAPGFAQVLWNLLDEFRQDENSQRQILRHINQYEGCKGC